MELTWHLSLANVLKILRDPCFNAYYSIKRVVKKQIPCILDILLHFSEGKTSGVQTKNYAPQFLTLS